MRRWQVGQTFLDVDETNGKNEVLEDFPTSGQVRQGDMDPNQRASSDTVQTDALVNKEWCWRGTRAFPPFLTRGDAEVGRGGRLKNGMQVK